MKLNQKWHRLDSKLGLVLTPVGLTPFCGIRTAIVCHGISKHWKALPLMLESDIFAF